MQSTMQLYQPTTAPHTRHCVRRCSIRSTSHVARASSSPAVAQDVDGIVQVVKNGSKSPGSVPPSALLQSLVELEKAKALKPQGEDLYQAVGGVWRLVYTAPSKDVEAARKGTKSGSGQFVPITAAGHYNPQTGIFENGVFFGNVANLTFLGPYRCDGRQLTFDVDTMVLGVGPWRLPINIKKRINLKDMDKKDTRNLPFFLFAYADDEIIAARGRSGGVATWLKADTDWQAKAGTLQVYK